MVRGLSRQWPDWASHTAYLFTCTHRVHGRNTDLLTYSCTHNIYYTQWDGVLDIQTVLSSHTYKVGDEIYLQKSGGPIGLELTGAVSRPYMMRWDSIYLQKVKKAWLEMPLYERYIDDSNQVAIVPPPGSKYDTVTENVVRDENNAIEAENEDERLARVLKEIANTAK